MAVSRVTVEGKCFVRFVRVSKRSGRYWGWRSNIPKSQTKLVVEHVMVTVDVPDLARPRYVHLQRANKALLESMRDCQDHQVRVTYTPKPLGPANGYDHQALRAKVECLDVGEHVLMALSKDHHS